MSSKSFFYAENIVNYIISETFGYLILDNTY